MGKSIFMIVLTSAIVLVATKMYGSNQYNATSSNQAPQTVLLSDTQNYEDKTISIIDDYINNDLSEDYEILGDGAEAYNVNIEPTVAPTANPTNTPIVTKKANISTTPKPTASPMPYYIKINRTQNVVNVYSRDSEGNYSNPSKAMLCSIGTSTPKAGSKYKITTYRRTWNGLKGGVYGQYAVQITGNILFHSVPYTAKNNYSLEYWEYDKLGTKASMGCIRLAVQDAKWIYDTIAAGTWVEFYEDEDPGPLGKPEAQKISDNELCRNWDPTDYVEGNPWHEPLVAIEDETIEIEDLDGENIIITEEQYNYEEYENEINEVNDLFETELLEEIPIEDVTESFEDYGVQKSQYDDEIPLEIEQTETFDEFDDQSSPIR